MDPRTIKLPVMDTLYALERATAPHDDDEIDEMALLAFDALDDARADGDLESVALYDTWLRAMQHVVDARESAQVWSR